MYGIIVLTIYALIMIGATVFFTKISNNTDDFHVANRNLGTVISMLSIAATWIWAPALFVSSTQAYSTGIPGLFWFLVPNVLCLIFFTHNRARGTHLLEPMKAIIKNLLDDGKTVDEIGKQLGMKPEEVFRLSDFSREDFLEMMTNNVSDFSKAELITKY